MTIHQNRTELLHSLRSEVPVDHERNPLELEQFQNHCLRSILKFQNDAFTNFFRSQIATIEIPVSEKERGIFIQQRLQKDLITRNTLIGMVLGLMSVEELSFYHTHKTELSRRIVGMLTQRLTGQL